MRYVLCLSYDGRPFCGWQIQPSAPSVQEVLQEALSRLCGLEVTVTGAGRTDTSVHASGYIAHFDLPGPLPFPSGDFCYKVNAILPRSVVVHGVWEATEDFHARFSARKRSYTYFIHREKDPFVEGFSWQCAYPGLDFAAMNEACQYLLGTHDFDCFEKTGGSAKTSVCTIYEAFWSPYTPSFRSVMGAPAGPFPAGPAGSAAAPATIGDTAATPNDPAAPAPATYWYFRVSADRFLRNMVRAIVGSLIEVGRGKQRPEWIRELVESGTRSDAGESVPGHALFLSHIDY